MDMNLNKFQETVKVREDWHAIFTALPLPAGPARASCFRRSTAASQSAVQASAEGAGHQDRQRPEGN